MLNALRKVFRKMELKNFNACYVKSINSIAVGSVPFITYSNSVFIFHLFSAGLLLEKGK